MKLGLKILAALAALGFAHPALSASLLPNGKQQIVDANGAPCVDCKLYFYIPDTTTPKDTWKDADQGTLNTNPVVLDSLGTAVIYGTGVYRQILKDATGTTLWDQLTADPVSLNACWGGLSTGAPNAQAVSVTNYSAEDGQIVCFLAGFTNTGPMTLDVNSEGAVSVVKDTSTGPQVLGGGEVVVGNAIQAIYSTATGTFHLLTPTPTLSFDGPVYFNGTITPTILAADQNDWTPTGGYTAANTIRVSSSLNISITGLTGGAAGRTLIIHNIGSFNITFVPNSASSLSANRFLLSAPVTLRPSDDITIQYDALSGGWRRWSPHSSNPVAAGFKNLSITNGGTPNNQLIGTADAVTVEDANGTAVRLRNVSCTADVTTTGTFTSSTGSLDTGGVANSTWYSFWFIFNPATNTPSCLLSTSTTSPTLPSGFTFYARLGWGRTDGTSHFYRIRQYGRQVQYIIGTNPTIPLIIGNGSTGTFSLTNPVLTSVSVTTFVPPTATMIKILATTQYLNGTNAGILVAPNTSWGGTANGPQGGNGVTWPVYQQAGLSTAGPTTATLLLETQAVAWASSNTGGAIAALGWEDNI